MTLERPTPRGWRPPHPLDRHAAGWRPTTTLTTEPIWEPCGTCWQQTRILVEGAWRTCGTCLGVGQVPAVHT